MPVAMLSSNLSFLTMTSTQTRTLKDPPWRKPANSASPCKHFFHSEQIPPGATLAEIPVFWCPTWSHIFLRLPVTAWQQITKHTEDPCSDPLIQYCQVDLEIHPSAYYLSLHRSISYSALHQEIFFTVFLTAHCAVHHRRSAQQQHRQTLFLRVDQLAFLQEDIT